jgi:hypothetical protein
MNAIEAQIRSIADDFVERLLGALRDNPLSELASALPPRANGAPARKNGHATAGSPTAARRRVSGGRRTTEQVVRLRAKVVSVVKSTPSGIAIGEIARRLGVTPGDVTRPLALAVKSGQLVRKGEKRLARYYPTRRAAA